MMQLKYFSQIVLVMLLVACSKLSEPVGPIIADIIDSEGAPVGSVSISEMRGGLRLFMSIYNLPPGIHASHIHEDGVCALPDFTSAGPHYNPFNRQHGVENSKGPHAGDLPNFEVGSARTSHVEITVKNLYVSNLEGRSLVIHEKEDDYVTGPSGNSGARIACAVLKS